MSRLRRAGLAGLAATALAALAAPVLSPQPPDRQHRDHPYAPPMPPLVRDMDGRWRAPFIHPLRLTDRLARTYEVDRTRAVPLRWLSDGRLVSVPSGVEGRGEPWLLLGGDGLGRDVFARLLHGARTSLGVSVTAVAGALLLGLLAGAAAGFRGGLTDEILMRAAEFVLLLPAVYVVLALRAALPLVVPAPQLFVMLALLMAVIGAPWVARGVRAIVAAEARRDYAAAAAALGARPARIVLRHLVPATRPFLVTQAALLLPSFILAEATLSFIGLGFAAPVTSWGTMLREAADVRVLADAPWLIAPAAAIAFVVLCVNLLADPAVATPEQHFGAAGSKRNTGVFKPGTPGPVPEGTGAH